MTPIIPSIILPSLETSHHCSKTNCCTSSPANSSSPLNSSYSRFWKAYFIHKKSVQKPKPKHIYKPISDFLEQHKDYEFSREILFKKEEQDDLDEYHFEFYKMLRYHPEFMTIHYVNAMIPDRAGWNGYNDFIILKNEKDYAIDERAFIERDHGFTSCSNKKTIHQKRKV